MLDKPLKFTLINLVAYLLILGIFGFKSSLYLSILISIGVIIYNYKFVGFSGGLVLSIIYLLSFDSELFYFTIANIRIWYLYLIILYFTVFFKFASGKIKLTFNKSNLLQYGGTILLLIWSIWFLFCDELIAKSYNIKYWLFYLGLLFMLNAFFKKHIGRFNQLSDYFISIALFICVFGIFQFIANLLFVTNFQLDFYNVRPSGFFSETTWYSEYIFFGLLFVFLKVLKNKKHRNYIYFIPLFLLGFVFSVTRNTFLALAIFLCLSFLGSVFIENKFYIRILGSLKVKVVAISIVICMLFFFPQIQAIFFDFFSAKFSGSDDSALGRLEAYKLSLNLITNGPVWGNGFYWDLSQATSSGSSLGAKSFNIFLMIAHIYGFFGFFIFISILIIYFYKLIRDYIKSKSVYIRYSIIVIICFLQMAMFAPIHQYPFGMLIVSLSSLLYLQGLHESYLCKPTT